MICILNACNVTGSLRIDTVASNITPRIESSPALLTKAWQDNCKACESSQPLLAKLVENRVHQARARCQGMLLVRAAMRSLCVARSAWNLCPKITKISAGAKVGIPRPPILHTKSNIFDETCLVMFVFNPSCASASFLWRFLCCAIFLQASVNFVRTNIFTKANLRGAFIMYNNT
jgi:hypothetical protein